MFNRKLLGLICLPLLLISIVWVVIIRLHYLSHSREATLTDVLPPSPVDQAIIAARSQHYTNDWITMNYNQLFMFLSSHSNWANKKQRQRWIKYLVRQHQKHEANPIPIQSSDIKFISESYITYSKIFILNLDDRDLKDKNGKFDAGMHLLPKNAAIVKFPMNHRIYYQLWIFDSQGGWQCIHFPLDLDEVTFRNIEQWK